MRDVHDGLLPRRSGVDAGTAAWAAVYGRSRPGSQPDRLRVHRDRNHPPCPRAVAEAGLTLTVGTDKEEPSDRFEARHLEFAEALLVDRALVTAVHDFEMLITVRKYATGSSRAVLTGLLET